MSDQYSKSLLSRIQEAVKRSVSFFNSLRTERGFKYTTTHHVAKYPAATLYGTWSAVLGLHLVNGLAQWSHDEKEWALARLRDHCREDRTFLGIGLEDLRNSKSLEYLILHCTNYAQGAALVLDPGFDFETPYLHRFLDGDVLAYWLDGRSFARPWEEGNNIVNVASYLALCNDHGEPRASSRLEQILAWHRKYQNPKTGGFDNFDSPARRHRLQAMAGAVHNFHLHLYLDEPMGYEQLIADTVTDFLLDGHLSACLSIDFVELAIRTLHQASEPQKTVWALVEHAEALLRYQRDDGGWLENATPTPTGNAGFKDEVASSCSYATWFRLAALGMISIVVLGDSPNNWHFRRTLGMGYAPAGWPTLPSGIIVERMPKSQKILHGFRQMPNSLRTRAVAFGSRFV